MARKREMDNLAKDAAAALAAGMSYGRWKAMQNSTGVIEKREELPEGWKICLRCGKPFQTNKYNRRKRYCELECQKTAQRERDKEKAREYYLAYKERKQAENKTQ